MGTVYVIGDGLVALTKWDWISHMVSIGLSNEEAEIQFEKLYGKVLS